MLGLVLQAIENKEPVLLCGETGCGKTLVCELIAAQRGQKIWEISCQKGMEVADFIGAMRPVRQEQKENGKLFEWVDGPLIQAMQNGGVLLIDEISLAEDSVLERLNSVLESERFLLVPEKCEEQGGAQIICQEEFCILATMNPGGDFGKRELSPALRNRFTEIWVDPITASYNLVNSKSFNYLLLGY